MSSQLPEELIDLIAAEEPEDYQETEPPLLDSLDDVDRQVRRIAKIRADLAERTAPAHGLIASLQAWIAEQKEAAEAKAAWHALSVRSWHERALEADPKRKTIKLPSGTLKARAGSRFVEVVDEEAALNWITAHAPELMVVTSRVSKTEVKKLAVKDRTYVSEDGEAIPGLREGIGDPSFSIETMMLEPSPEEVEG